MNIYFAVNESKTGNLYHNLWNDIVKHIKELAEVPCQSRYDNPLYIGSFNNDLVLGDFYARSINTEVSVSINCEILYDGYMAEVYPGDWDSPAEYERIGDNWDFEEITVFVYGKESGDLICKYDSDNEYLGMDVEDALKQYLHIDLDALAYENGDGSEDPDDRADRLYHERKDNI